MTISEDLFEHFCAFHGLVCSRIEEGTSPTPDYLVGLGGVDAIVEVKQIDEDDNFSSVRGSRTIGDHVRAKINQARDQVRMAGARGTPAILLIYNNLDPLQEFGTGLQDFRAAMYGEPTVVLSVETGAIVNSFDGRNQSFRPGKNEAFSAIGHLKRTNGAPLVHLYENLFAKVPLSYQCLPPCITYTRIEVAGNGDA